MKHNTLSVDQEWVDAVKITSGGWNGLFNIAGWTVATIQAALADPLGVPATALAFVNGKEVEPSYRLQAKDILEFVQPDDRQTSIQQE